MSEFEWAVENAQKTGASVCNDYLQASIPMVGFCLKNKWVFYWFKVVDGWLLFDHAYSMNTGKSKRGLRTRMHASTLWLPVHNVFRG
jgi:hypothetical protein